MSPDSIERITGPASFIEGPWQEDPLLPYSTSFFPYAYSAFTTWRQAIGPHVDDEIKAVLHSGTTVRMLDTWAYGTLVLSHGVIDESGRPKLPDLPTKFPVSISEYAIPKSTEEAQKTISAWFSFLLRRNWTQFTSGSPMVADLTIDTITALNNLPKRMLLGEYPIIRIFDYFYAPDKHGAQWARTLFDHLATQYERISDLVFKEEVAKVLFKNISSGAVLDIGCGTGLAQKWIGEWGRNDLALYGLDISPEMIGYAQSRGEITAIGNAAQAIPFTDQDFTSAVMLFVDHWLTSEERLKTFDNVSNRLQTGSWFKFNLYHPETGWETAYKELLVQTGFSHILCFSLNLSSTEGLKKSHFVFAQK